MRRLEDWIEYLEGEGDLKQMGQLSMLLKHSIADQVVLDNLRRLRKVLKKCDKADQMSDIVQNAEFLNDLHEKIMHPINDVQGRSKNLTKPSSVKPDEDSDFSQESCKN